MSNEQESDEYSNSNSCDINSETMVFEAEWRGNLFQMKVFPGAFDSVEFASNSELSWRFSGCLKISVLFENLGLPVAFEMRPDRVPGDLGFDPLGLKPSNEGEFGNR